MGQVHRFTGGRAFKGAGSPSGLRKTFPQKYVQPWGWVNVQSSITWSISSVQDDLHTEQGGQRAALMDTAGLGSCAHVHAARGSLPSFPPLPPLTWIGYVKTPDAPRRLQKGIISRAVRSSSTTSTCAVADGGREGHGCGWSNQLDAVVPVQEAERLPPLAGDQPLPQQIVPPSAATRWGSALRAGWHRPGAGRSVDKEGTQLSSG